MKMRVADYIIMHLKNIGVEHAFFLSGGMMMHLTDALVLIVVITLSGCVNGIPKSRGILFQKKSLKSVQNWDTSQDSYLPGV